MLTRVDHLLAMLSKKHLIGSSNGIANKMLTLYRILRTGGAGAMLQAALAIQHLTRHLLIPAVIGYSIRIRRRAAAIPVHTAPAAHKGIRTRVVVT